MLIASHPLTARAARSIVNAKIRDRTFFAWTKRCVLHRDRRLARTNERHSNLAIENLVMYLGYGLLAVQEVALPVKVLPVVEQNVFPQAEQ